jgi:hypothetical protein
MVPGHASCSWQARVKAVRFQGVGAESEERVQRRARVI